MQSVYLWFFMGQMPLLTGEVFLPRGINQTMEKAKNDYADELR